MSKVDFAQSNPILSDWSGFGAVYHTKLKGTGIKPVPFSCVRIPILIQFAYTLSKFAYSSTQNAYTQNEMRTIELTDKLEFVVLTI